MAKFSIYLKRNGLSKSARDTEFATEAYSKVFDTESKSLRNSYSKKPVGKDKQ